MVTGVVGRSYNLMDAASSLAFERKNRSMRRFLMAGLMAVAPIALSNQLATAGSVHLGPSKAEVQQARVELYEHEMHVRGKDPAAFDHKLPVLGKILASEQGYDQFLSEHTFRKLLCEHTPFLWRVVDGDILYHKVHPFVITRRVPDGVPNLHFDVPPSIAGFQGRDNDPGGSGGSGGSFHPNAVPEPSSWVLLAGGATLALVAATRRRIYSRLSKSRTLSFQQMALRSDQARVRASFEEREQEQEQEPGAGVRGKMGPTLRVESYSCSCSCSCSTSPALARSRSLVWPAWLPGQLMTAKLRVKRFSPTIRTTP